MKQLCTQLYLINGYYAMPISAAINTNLPTLVGS